MASHSTDNDRLDVSSLFSPQLEGQLRPWSASQMGLQYPGEVILASRWNDAWGQELTDDRYFRIVLLTSRQRPLTAPLRDARILVCIPAQHVLRHWDDLDRELRSIAEARGLYTNRRQADSSALRSTLEQRETELRREFLEGRSRSYGSGQIRNTMNMDHEAGRIFGSSDPGWWLQDLAGFVLTRVYPSLPIDAGSFPRTLLETDLPAIFDGFLADVPQRPAEGAITSFATGLRLARKSDPSAFDPEGCADFGLIQQELERQGPGGSVQELCRLLGHAHGLPLPLVALFVLAFMKHSSPETELDLTPDSALTTIEGGPFQGDCLTWDLVWRVRWHQDMGAMLTWLHLPEPPTWNTALPFVQIMDPEVESHPPQDVARKEARLLSKLGELGDSAQQALADIQVLLEEGDVAPAERRGVGDIGDRLPALVALGRSSDYGQYYDFVRQTFRQPSSLSHERHLPAQALQLKAILPELPAVWSYLKDMSFGPKEDTLALDHQALNYETKPVHILENMALWAGVKGRFERLRRTFGDVYVRYHGQYRRETSALSARLQHTLPLVEALEQFNSIPELGTRTAEELPLQFEQVNTSIKMCPASEEDVDLEERTVCSYCGLRLWESVPYSEVETLVTDVEQCVQEQNRRLSRDGIQQILVQWDEHVVDRLIKIVRMADLTNLSNALSPQVLAFLRTFLASR